MRSSLFIRKHVNKGSFSKYSIDHNFEAELKFVIGDDRFLRPISKSSFSIISEVVSVFYFNI